jgi:predicted double-glycine peptidase
MKCIFRYGTVYLLAITLQGCAASAGRISGSALPIRTGALHGMKPIHTWKELRYENVVLQRFDYSCGAGALATLMRFYFGDNVSEETILVGILDSMNEEEVKDRETNGLSLLDLKNYSERRGYQAVAVRLNYASLPELMGPVLIHLERKNYRHFAVLKGVRGDRIYLADPSRGNVRISIDQFAKEWSGIALVLGKEGFGLPRQYPLALEDQELIPNEMLNARESLFNR